MTGFKMIEKTYGVKIVDDSFYNPKNGRFVRCYAMYSADGCRWENGLSREGVHREIERWGKDLLEIKKNVENKRKVG